MLVLSSLLIWFLAFLAALSQLGRPSPGFYVDPILTVSPLNDTQGLTQYDALLFANGHPLKSQGDLLKLIRSVPAGTPISYEFRRNGHLKMVEVPTTRSDRAEFLRNVLPLLITALLHFLVGGLSFWRKPRNRAAQAHLLMTFAVGMTCLVNAYITTSWMPRLWLASLFLLGSAFMHLALVFPERKAFLARRRGLEYLVYLPAIVAALVFEVAYRPLGYLANPSGVQLFVHMFQLWALWLFIGLLTLIGSIIWSAFHASTPVARVQARIAAFGAVASYLPNALIFLLPVMLGDSSAIPSPLISYSRLFAVIFPLFMAYAIVRHKLFDIDLAIKRTVVYTTVIGSLAGAYFITILLVRAGIAFFFGTATSMAGNLLATAVVASLFSPVRDQTKRTVDRFFFRAAYDFQQVVTRFGERAREILDLPQLLATFLGQVDESLHPTFLALLLNHEGGQQLVLAEGKGLSEGWRPAIPLSDPVLSARPEGTIATWPAGTETDGALCLPLRIKDELLGCVLVGPKRSQLAYHERDRLLLSHLAQHLAVWLKNAQLFGQLAKRAAELEDLVRLYEQANQQAMTDSLTQLYNRRAFQQHLVHSFAEAQRYGRPLSVILFDVDHFKRFNDSHGHATGDRVLVLVAQSLRTAVRLSDIAARWGGEEFVVGLPETRLADALLVAERIRQSMENTPLLDEHERPIPPVTVSLGVATFIPEDDRLEALVERADRALYLAKAKGRNQVQYLEEQETSKS